MKFLDIVEYYIEHGGVHWSSDLLDFSSNLNPCGSPEVLDELIQEAVQKRVYKTYPDVSKITYEIAEFENLDPEDVIVTGGASYAIHDLILSLVKPRVIIRHDLTYSDYIRYARSLRIPQVVLKSAEVESRIVSNVDTIPEIVMRIPEERCLMVFVNPNNPTGTYFNLQDLFKICEHVYSTVGDKVTVLLDLSFIDFLEHDRTLVKKFLDLDNVYLVKSYTKIFACPGLRIGIIASRSLQRRVVKPSWPVSSICEYVFTRLIGEYRDLVLRFIEKTRRFVSIETRSVISKLRELLPVFDSDVHFFLVKTRFELDSILETRFRMRIRRVCKLSDGSMLFRISIRQREDNMKLIEAVRSLCQDLRYEQP